jgi:uncharacterized protein YndB with AHSA1/START domain
MDTPDQRSQPDDAARGTVETVGGRLVLRYERRLAHPPERVWRAITEPAQLEKWFPAAVEMEDLVAGGVMHFTFREKDVDSPDGRITELDPPRVLAFDWGPENLRFELRPEPHGCLLVFTNTLDDRSKLARVGAGWHLCLDLLEAELDGRAVPWDPDERWKRLYGDIYETAFD